MAFIDVNDPDAIRKAAREFDQLGRDAFLKKYGFGKARDYYLLIGGKRYDSKAIFGAAHGYQFPDLGPLGYEQFSGGAATVERKLEAMGFRIERGNSELVDAQKKAEASGAFDPNSIEDAREKTLAAIVRRQGQPAFRKSLLRAYHHKCAITRCEVTQVLEAAHIVPYQGPKTNHVSNGLLLRADLHTLFDLFLITVEPKSKRIVVSPTLDSTEYRAMHGQVLNLPTSVSDHPSEDALRMHFNGAGLSL
ncbi:HNH endonuclease [Paraburkholderia unamae]|uniref:HNH endonuclease n=1 Tax=Paraburkholderia unamae TaxID=219649 RepID=A0ACC6RUF8_9BURK